MSMSSYCIFRNTIRNHFIRPLVSKYYSTKKEPKIKIALLQLDGSSDKCKNLENARMHIAQAKEGCAELVALPECFNSPYGTNFFKEYAEKVGEGPTSEMLSNAAKENSVYVVGGTFPEITDDCKIYNTCTVWNPEGKLIATYRKMHLFDIDIPGKITFKESDVLTPGKEMATFCVKDVVIGLGICYDMRFEEFAKLYRFQGCKMFIFPAAFNMTTGPLHWELLQRARAVDNQVFVVTISPARGSDGYIAYGHSLVVSPWAKVLAEADACQEIVYCDLNFIECTEVRAQIPVFPHRRQDVYNTIKVKKC